MSDNLEIIHVTFPNEELAKKLGKSLVEMKLAACCQVIPKISSFYIWEEKLCEDNEALMIIKSLSSNRSKIEAHIIENHEYDTPSFVVTESVFVNDKYMAWAKG